MTGFKRLLRNKFYPVSEEILNSYSILFFSNSKLLGAMLLLITFFKPFAGLAGLVSVIIAISFSFFTGISRDGIQKGLFSFNALMIGIGMGTFYNQGLAFWWCFSRWYFRVCYIHSSVNKACLF
jgi:urea transporter